jgi:hypothetical protein
MSGDYYVLYTKRVFQHVHHHTTFHSVTLRALTTFLRRSQARSIYGRQLKVYKGGMASRNIIFIPRVIKSRQLVKIIRETGSRIYGQWHWKLGEVLINKESRLDVPQ